MQVLTWVNDRAAFDQQVVLPFRDFSRHTVEFAAASELFGSQQRRPAS
jgi:hypothetical protein